MKNIINSISQKLKLDKKAVAIILVGVLGVFLLALSEIIPDKQPEADEEQTKETAGYENYSLDIEERLESLISSIYGAGKTKVMVTLECSDENVYAVDEKSSESMQENKVVIIETQNGENGMLLKVTEPKIRGVAVVCEGGASATVRQSIIEAITAVLDISAARVSIATMKTDNGG
ncbi:MAG: hypothetical protein IJZ88_08545 [Clostridia bacterium]|nr:hypothetical protein [Clostridia bacterium]